MKREAIEDEGLLRTICAELVLLESDDEEEPEGLMPIAGAYGGAGGTEVLEVCVPDDMGLGDRAEAIGEQAFDFLMCRGVEVYQRWKVS